jgi:hypothetical protein
LLVVLDPFVDPFDQDKGEVRIEDTDAREVVLLCGLPDLELVSAVRKVFDPTTSATCPKYGLGRLT